MSRKYFACSEDHGMQFFNTAKEASEFANDLLDSEREDAADYGWSDNIEWLCWGEVNQAATETMRRPKNASDINDDFDEIVEYQLKPDFKVAKTGEFGGFNTLAEQVADLIKVWMLTADNNVSIALENSQGNQVIFAYVRSEGILESVVTDHITIYCAKDDASARIMDAIHMIARHINMTQYKKYQSYTA